MALQPKAPPGPFSRLFSRLLTGPALHVCGAGLVLFALVWSGWVWLWPGTDVAVVVSARAAPDRPAFVPSQQGTAPDGELRLMKAPSPGNEVSTLAYAELRRLFDYYLSALGEQDLPAITQQIQSQLSQRLEPTQAQKAKRLLDLYIAFRRALIQLEAKPGLAGDTVAAIRQRMLAQQSLRAHYFNAAEIEGMFGFEDAYDADAVARLEISQNPQLKPDDKKKQLAALDAAMSPALRADRDASMVVVRVEQRASEMRAQGASDDEVYRMRAQEFDAGAAARLAEVDQEEAAWKQRIAVYLDARAQVLKAQTNATPSERQQALSALQQRLFTEDERRRLLAYEPAG